MIREMLYYGQPSPGLRRGSQSLYTRSPSSRQCGTTTVSLSPPSELFCLGLINIYVPTLPFVHSQRPSFPPSLLFSIPLLSAQLHLMESLTF